MTVETPAPRWLAAVWLWLPAAAALVLFGGVAVLQAREVSAWWAFAAVACSAAYAGRERWPVPALAATLVVVATTRLPGVPVLNEQFDVAYLLLLFVPVLPLVAVASRLEVRRSWFALAATIVVTVGSSPALPWTTDHANAQETLIAYVLNVGVPTMIALGAWLGGCTLLTLERTRDAEAARAVAEERARIGRELHDVVTHSVAVMVVQASAAGAAWERDPEQARASLRAVEESGRTVMADLRGMLGTMRDSEVPTAAQPGLEQLTVLTEQVRAAGVAARLTVSGAPETVAPATGLSLLRIAQESVTNALRHAHASSIEVDLLIEPDAVRLSVTDDGVGLGGVSADRLDPQRQGGQGLVGMRERAAVIGGSLSIGPGPGGGTVVLVQVPA